jgi:hypothetical protein
MTRNRFASFLGRLRGHVVSAAVFFALSVGLAGCLSSYQDVPRSTFAKDGILLGQPVKMGNGDYELPIHFTTEIVHSGKWLHDVRTELDRTTIYVTAVFTSAGSSAKKGLYDGAVKLQRLHPLRQYNVKYRDPDGRVHDLGTVIPAS